MSDFKLTTMVLGQNLVAPWDVVDWESDAGWPCHPADGDSPGALYDLWHDAVVRSRASVARAMTQGGLDARIKYGFGDDPDNAVSLRRVLPIRASGQGVGRPCR